jgi:hypothetical protein
VVFVATAPKEESRGCARATPAPRLDSRQAEALKRSVRKTVVHRYTRSRDSHNPSIHSSCLTWSLVVTQSLAYGEDKNSVSAPVSYRWYEWIRDSGTPYVTRRMSDYEDRIRTVLPSEVLTLRFDIQAVKGTRSKRQFSLDLLQGEDFSSGGFGAGLFNGFSLFVGVGLVIVWGCVQRTSCSISQAFQIGLGYREFGFGQTVDEFMKVGPVHDALLSSIS